MNQKLTPTKMRYANIERENLAVVLDAGNTTTTYMAEVHSRQGGCTCRCPEQSQPSKKDGMKES